MSLLWLALPNRSIDGGSIYPGPDGPWPVVIDSFAWPVSGNLRLFPLSHAHGLTLTASPQQHNIRIPVSPFMANEFSCNTQGPIEWHAERRAWQLLQSLNWNVTQNWAHTSSCSSQPFYIHIASLRLPRNELEITLSGFRVGLYGCGSDYGHDVFWP